MADLFKGRTAVLASKHKKEQVIGPLLEKLGVTVVVPEGLDTDILGTFTGEIKRPASQRETLRMKAKIATKATGADLVIASEGAFGPHPQTFGLTNCNVELVMLLDTLNNLEIVGEYFTGTTNFSRQSISSVKQGLEFADRVGFPDHALIISYKTWFGLGKHFIKGITTKEGLIQAIETGLSHAKEVTIETDMRAMHNPTRMEAIKKATENLIEKLAKLSVA